MNKSGIGIKSNTGELSMPSQDPSVGLPRIRCICVSTFAGTVDPPLSDSIRTALRDARNISTLYTHQATAIDALSQGKNVIVSTSTASGKSVIYQVTFIVFLPCLYLPPSLQRYRCCVFLNKMKGQRHFSFIRPRSVLIYPRFALGFNACSRPWLRIRRQRSNSCWLAALV